MKLKYICSLIAGVLLLFACTPDKYEMGSQVFTPEDLVEGVAYTVTHDADNPNIIYLKSLLGPEYTPLWEHPQGRSQAAEVTLQIAFEGTYEVTFGVETRGGVVYGAPTTFTIDDFCAEFVTDELWTLLTGGVGNSKTWVYDNGGYGLASGDLSYGDPEGEGNANWGWNNFVSNWDPAAGEGACGTDDWASYMTFDLNGNSNYSFYNSATGTTQTGLFSMNTTDHTINFTNADMMHPDSWTARKADWRRDFRIITLTENQLRIGYKRQTGSWGGEWLEVFNYVSQEYAENYKAPEVEVYPTLEEDWRDYVEPKTNQIITYVLDATKPYDWCNTDGSLKNVTSVAASGIEDLELTINSREGTYTVTAGGGVKVNGTYTLSDDGIYTFSAGLPEVMLSADGRAVFKLGADNALRIMQYKLDDYSGGLSDLWLGAMEQDAFGRRYQYMGYHFVPKTSGGETVRYTATLNLFESAGWSTLTSTQYITGDGSYTFSVTDPCLTTDPSVYGIYLDVAKILNDYPNVNIVITDIKSDGTSIEFNDADFTREYGEADNKKVEDTARRYILNPWNPESAATGSRYLYESSLEITIQVTMDSGSPFITE